MFETVLVADRGLLAVRIIRSCQRLGIKAVTCLAEGDENALHARAADEVIRVGVADPATADADADAVIEAARVCGAAGVHPGGGHWATHAGLARAVRVAELAWIGADPDAPGEQPAWRETVRRAGHTLVWEAAAAEAGRVLPTTLSGPDRLVEALTRTDLVERQLRQATGERLDDTPAGSGYAMQAALYAGPQTLVPVTVRGWVPPQGDEGVVVDGVLADGARLTRYDDAVLARVTAHGTDRGQALERLTTAVDGMALAEPPADLAALRALLREPSVVSMVG